MKNILLITLALMALLNSSCKKEKTKDPLFKLWSVCGNCLPSDVVITLTEDGLYNQDNLKYPDSLFQMAQQILIAQPAILCDAATNTYGCAGCYDGSDYFIEKHCGAVERTWSFDPYDTSQPATVLEYAQMLRILYRNCTE